MQNFNLITQNFLHMAKGVLFKMFIGIKKGIFLDVDYYCNSKWVPGIHYTSGMEYSLIICTWHLMYFFHYFISLRTTDAICWHRHWSTLAQVMACCLTAPSHNLNHCWLKTRFISTCISRNILGKLHIKKYFFLVFLVISQGPMSLSWTRQPLQQEMPTIANIGICSCLWKLWNSSNSTVLFS